MRVCGLWTGNWRERLYNSGSGFPMSRCELIISGSLCEPAENHWERAKKEWK